jgi:uncharacterized protein (DUF2147 family)
MRKIFAIATALAGLSFASVADARSPIEGRWDRGDMQIDIKPCGSTLCGTVVAASAKQKARAASGSGTNLIGATLIKQIEPTGPKTYKAQVFLADRNRNASGKILQLNPNRLRVSGCMLMVLCRTTHWDRVR